MDRPGLRRLDEEQWQALAPVLAHFGLALARSQLWQLVDENFTRSYQVWLLDLDEQLVLKQGSQEELAVHRQLLAGHQLPCSRLLDHRIVQGRCWLLMRRACGDDLHHCDREGALAAAGALAAIQASHWRSDPSLWLARWREQVSATSALLAEWPRLVAALERLQELREQQPWTLVQGDLHPLNILLDRCHTPPRATVVDWADGGIGPWCSDAARFLAFSAPHGAIHQLDEDARQAFLRRWPQALVEHGIDAAELDAMQPALAGELCLQHARHLCWTLERDAPRDDAFQDTLAAAHHWADLLG